MLLPGSALSGPLSLVGALCLVGVALVWLALPRTHALTLSSWPSVPWIMAQAVVSLVKSKKRRSAGDPLKQLQVFLATPVRVNPAKLKRFHQLTGGPAAGPGGGSGQMLPLMYPIVESFRLCMQAMLLPDFPFNVMGAVLARNECCCERGLLAGEQLVYSCSVDPAIRTTAKGHSEVDLLTTAAAASSGQVVWRNSLTVIILGKRAKGTSTGQQPPAPLPAAAPASASWPHVLEQLRLGPGAGRAYGALCGDLNPIHVHALTARLLGFKRPIAHALYITAMAEAALRRAGVTPSYPCTLSAEFKRPTLLPATLLLALPAPARAVLAACGGPVWPAGTACSFSVLTADCSKEVLVGEMRVGAPAK